MRQLWPLRESLCPKVLLRHHAEDVGSVFSLPLVLLGQAPKATIRGTKNVRIKLHNELAVTTAAPSSVRSPCRAKDMVTKFGQLAPLFMIRGVARHGELHT